MSFYYYLQELTELIKYRARFQQQNKTKLFFQFIPIIIIIIKTIN